MKAKHLFSASLLVGTTAFWAAAAGFMLHGQALRGERPVVAVFAPWTSETAAYLRLLEAGAAPVRRLPSGRAWLAVPADPGVAAELSSEALLLAVPAVLGSSVATCAGWLPADKATASSQASAESFSSRGTTAAFRKE